MLQVRRWFTTYRWELATGLLVLAGFFIRLKEFLANRALDFDEAGVAGYLLLDKYQENITQPPLFLTLERVAINLWGYGEQALRLQPFVLGVIAIPLFWWLCRKMLDKYQTFVAVTLFTLLDPLTDYTTQLKQYSGELVGTLLVVLFFLHLKPRLTLSKWYWLLLVAGALAPWMGYPVVFVLAAVSVILLLRYLLLNRTKRFPYFKLTSELWLLGGLGVVWGASFMVMYIVWATRITGSSLLTDFWEYAYLNPLHFTYFRDRVLRIFNDPLGLNTALGGFLFGMGAIALYFKRKAHAPIIVLPLCFTIIAAMLKVYPYHGRLLYFLVPLLIIGIAYGLVALVEYAGKGNKLVWLLVLFVLLYPAFSITYNKFRNPRQKEESRQVISRIKANIKPTDSLYIHIDANRAFTYYTYGDDTWFTKAHYGEDHSLDLDAYLKEVQAVKNTPRTWFLFAHNLGVERDRILQYIKQSGGKIEETYSQRKAEAYLVKW